MVSVIIKEISKRKGMDDYFIHCKIFLTILGLWPYQSWVSLIFFRYFWIIQHISIMLPEAIKIYENRKEIDLVMEALATFLYNVVMAVKFINGVVNQNKIKSVLMKVKTDWNSLTDDNELDIIHEFGRSGKRLNTAYIAIVYIVLLSYMFLPITPVVLDFINPLNESRPKQPLYMVELFIDQDKYFYSILLHAYITSLASVLPLFANDFLLCCCVHHACGMLAILGRRIRYAVKYKPKKIIGEEEEFNEAINCVIKHQSIIQFCDDINAIYSTSFFVVLSICIVMMSCTGVVTVFKLEESFKDSIRFAMFTIAQIFHMFCYNFMGQKLYNYGEGLIDYAYNSDWYRAHKKTKYIINFMIFRSLKPSKVQANIFPLTLENFTTVMKTSMSYFTVLKSTR